MRKPVLTFGLMVVVATVACGSEGVSPGPGPVGGSGGSRMTGGARAGGSAGAEDDGGRAAAGSAGTEAGGSAGTGGAASSGGEGGADGSDGPACLADGRTGDCVDVATCAARPGSSAIAGFCPGPANIQCCVVGVGPSTADNPPTPAGYHLMMDADVTDDMTAWAVMILDDPVHYPMFATTTKTFDGQLVLARVQWHPPDFNNESVHRGVTLFVPI